MEDIDKKEQPPITDQVKEYFETYIKLVRLKAIDRGTSVVAAIVTDVAMIFAVIVAFWFTSITLAFYLSQLLHSYWQGFGCVALLYILIVVLISVFKKSLERPIVNILLKKLFK